MPFVSPVSLPVPDNRTKRYSAVNPLNRSNPYNRPRDNKIVQLLPESALAGCTGFSHFTVGEHFDDCSHFSGSCFRGLVCCSLTIQLYHTPRDLQATIREKPKVSG
jgi:hypothetical protein